MPRMRYIFGGYTLRYTRSVTYWKHPTRRSVQTGVHILLSFVGVLLHGCVLCSLLGKVPTMYITPSRSVCTQGNLSYVYDYSIFITQKQ